MGRFLDQQVSQNSSTTGSIGIILVDSSPMLFGTLGLDVSEAGPNLRIQFTALVTISGIISEETPITIDIFRGTGPDAVLIYSLTELLPMGTVLKAVIADGVDYTPPNSGFLIYQAFVSKGDAPTQFPARRGPESFSAAAYSD
ncbi:MULTISPECIES: hypothetical protein [unclassified Paenibacillus]|uniref:hypothetical protein n=1 Tax=unclassified Paenibacillus TaxID=185978 RepID=UPI0008389F60|nr:MULTISPECIES: hypothetical protein [unclassified Paenibacillus]NWL89121.1 hypothetical protein [Paenibacillus sp. 79R4]